MFTCPVCKEKLIPSDKSFFCTNNHCFDRAKEGYINLLTKRHSADPGDTIDMVDARRRFLGKGYYELFRKKACELVKTFTSKEETLVDAGCGEGYYTRSIGQNRITYGYDISKNAIRRAAKADKQTLYAVAGSYDIPFEDRSADIVCAFFSPIVPVEFRRILKPGGYMLLAVPTQRHLFGLKELIYDEPYENEYKETAYEGFSQVERVSIHGILTTDSNQDIMDLFSMTPYYWKSSKESSMKAKNATHLDTEIGFDFLLYKKN